MTCDECLYADTIKSLVEDSKRNSETHEKFYGQFKDLEINNAVKEERDKNTFLILQSIQKDVTELKSRPGKMWGTTVTTIVVAIVTFLITFIGNQIF